MKKIKDALKHLADRLTYRKGDLKKARGLAKNFRELAQREHDRQLRAEAHGHPRRAARLKRRAEARQLKAIYWKGRIKADLAAIHNLNERIEKRTAELDEWMKTHGVTFTGPNKVEGGTPHQRLR
jgi:Cdc6-like AAA superfamily ATPase